MLNNKVYDVLKWLCAPALPALIVFLSAVLPVFGVEPEIVRNVATVIAATDTFIGALIGISSYQYNKKKGDDLNE